MKAPSTAPEKPQFPAPGYDAYARLVKMLLPSAGCLAIYADDGKLVWCSDGFERPEFRELVDEIQTRAQGLIANQGTIRKTDAGVSVLLAKLCDGSGQPLGYALIELGGAHSIGGPPMAVSLTQPMLACLAAQLTLERPVAAAARQSTPAANARLQFLLGIGEIDLNGPAAVRDLLGYCVDRLGCVSAAICIPDQDLAEVAERDTLSDDETRARLDDTRKHLLAWVQLNNRPMVVNRIDRNKAPYKILSCPVVGRDGAAAGLLALFRTAGGEDFELDDVRLIEFVSRQAMALLHERRDALTGLMNRNAFERRLDEALSAASSESRGRLLYLDIEALAAINECFGYGVGDEAIRRAAQLLRRSLLPNEPACRLGGGRFVVHLPDRDAGGAATLAAGIVRSAAESGFTAAGQRVPLGLGYGIAAPLPGGDVRARHWIAAAELACRQPESERGQSTYNATGAERGVRRETE